MRKLAIAALAFSAGIFAANFIVPVKWLIVPAVLLAVCAAALISLRRRWLRGFVIAMLFCSLGLLDYYAQYQLTVEKAQTLAVETRAVEARLLSYPVDYGDYCRAECRIESDDLPGFKALLYDNSDSIADATPGDVLSFDCSIKTADTLYGEDYDYYYSKGIFLKLNTKEEPVFEKQGFDFRSLPAYISHYLSGRLTDLFPEDTESFMRSLMLGDRSGLYEDEPLVKDLSRAGFMHIVAVSGMHIAFVVGFLRLILGASRKSSLICIIFVWSFTLITGAGPATLRAAVMQTMLLLASVFYRENDPLTSLSVALALILACKPLSASSVSLQMSFGSMAGILCYSGKMYSFLAGTKQRSRLRLVNYVFATVSSSLSVMVFLLPLTALHFGYVSLLSLLTNVAGLWAVSLCFCGGWISCLLPALPLLGQWSAWLCSWLARYIFWVAGIVSGIPYGVLYMETYGAWLWLILSYAAFIVSLSIKKKTAVKYLVPASISASLLIGIFAYARYNYSKGADTFSVIDVGQGQSIAAFSGDSTVVIDCGNTFSLDNAGEITGAYLSSCGRKRIDMLILTHLHEDHANGVGMLMEMLPVDKLILPKNVGDPDYIEDEILKAAQKHGTEVIYVDEDTTLECGEISMELFAPLGGEKENERCLTELVSLGDYDALITGDSPAKIEEELISTHDIHGVELIVVGHHGSKYSSSIEYLYQVNGEYAAISSGFNTFGHPSEETLERLSDSGYNILSTKEDGTIEIRVD